MGCNTFRRRDSISVRTAASSALRFRSASAVVRSACEPTACVNSSRWLSDGSSPRVVRALIDSTFPPLPCPSAQREHSAGRALLSDCLLVARKFCTVMQTSVKIAYHGLGMGNFQDIALPRDLGRGFRNGGLISETGD